MKKIFSMLLALAMMFSLVACGGTTAEPTTAPAETVKNYEGTMEELVNTIITEQPVEFMGGLHPVDLADTSEDGLWSLKYYTGLDSAEGIADIAVFEPMMSSLAFSLVALRTTGDVKTVAEAMKSGIDTRKWFCVEANDLQVVSFGDVVMLIMVDNVTGLTSQAYVDAFAKICGGEVTVY